MTTHDRDIREPLFGFLEDNYGKIRIIEEKSIGDSRADVVMVAENAIYGIEIKSDADTYIRLAGQVEDYNRYFDFNYCVVGSSHGMHIEEHLPKEWGIITAENVEGKIDFYILRRPERNGARKMGRKIRLLWRPELAHIQELREMPAYKYKSKAFVADYIVQNVPENELDLLISNELFERDYTTIAERINEYRKANGQKARRKRKKKKYRKCKI